MGEGGKRMRKFKQLQITWQVAVLLAVAGASQVLSQACSTLDDGPMAATVQSSSSSTVYRFGTSGAPLTGGQDAIVTGVRNAYTDVLGSLPDQATLDAKVAAANANTLTVPQLRLQLAQSPQSTNTIRTKIQAFLNRIATDGEVQNIQVALSSGALKFSGLDSFILNNSAYSSTVRDFTRLVYRGILVRNPEQSAIDNIRSAIQNGQTYQFIRQGTAQSEEARGRINEVFQRTLQRGPSGDEYNYWVQQLANGSTIPDLQAQLLNGSAFAAMFNSNESKYVARAYVEILHRAPDSDGLNTYINLIKSNGNYTAIRTILADSSEGTDRINDLYNALLGRAALADELYSQKIYLQNGGNLVAMRLGILGGAFCMGTPSCAGGS